jgi:enoyl-CoA hydratase/carnithine racemase
VAALRVARENGVTRLTLDRPPLNVLTPDLIDALGAACRAVSSDPEVRVVVLAGAGRAFSAGVDVAVMRELDMTGARAFIERLRATIRALEDVPVRWRAISGSRPIRAGWACRRSRSGSRP